MRESGGDQGTAKPSKLWNLGDLQGAAYVHGHLMAESGLDVLRPGFVSAADITNCLKVGLTGVMNFGILCQ